MVDRPLNGVIFKAYVEQVLAPTLTQGDIVILDNLASHKVAGIRQAIAATGATLVYLPPYSPDLNPIEQASPSSRPCRARPAHAPSQHYGNDRRAPPGLHAFTPQECRDFFANSRYASD